ncbi:acyl-CoA thioesterase [soil metagenome]
MNSDRITLRFLAGPGDVTVSGTAVPAGRVLEWIDRAAYACAVGWSGSYCVTAYVGDVNFAKPIRPGDLIQVHARLVLTGRSSMHILVSVESADVRTREFSTATTCLLVMVAVDEHGQPNPVEAWKPFSEGDATLEHRARARIEPRRLIQEVMRGASYTDRGTAPRTVFRFLAAPADANWGGNAHGGTVMRWIDETIYACAASWSSERAVAVYAGGIQFVSPIHIGHVVEVDARIIHTSARSMHVSARVRSGSPRTPHELTLTTQCLSVFVVPGDDGRAQPVAPLPLRTGEDLELDAHARQLIAMRRSMAVIPSGLARA